MTINRTLAVLSLILSCVVSLRAQPAAVQELQNNQMAQQLQAPLPGLLAGTNAPELYQGENEDIGPQRILRLNPRPDYFDVLFDSQFFYTDNANFAQNPNMIPSGVFVNTLQAAFTSPVMKLGSGKFTATAGFASQWYNYENNRMSPFDFEAQTFFVGAKYNLGNWQFGAGGNYTRLLNQANYNQTYTEWMPTLGVQRIFQIGNKMLFSVGDQIDYHFTAVPSVAGSRPDINDRFDDTVSLTFSWQLTSHLILQPYYRFQYSNYHYDTLMTSDRNDYLNTFGVTLFYYFNKNTSLRVYFNYNRKQSDDPLTPSYHEYDGGLGGALDLKF
jgi:hypothetical protein